MSLPERKKVMLTFVLSSREIRDFFEGSLLDFLVVMIIVLGFWAIYKSWPR